MGGNASKPVNPAPDWLFSDLPAADIINAYVNAGGNELASGKLSHPESSAALVANTFGYFLNRPEAFPPVPAFGAVGWPARRVALEESLRFPWPGGMHPWLDVVIETDTHLVAIESKRYEPFRQKGRGSFSRTYWQPKWGYAMGPFEQCRDRLAEGTLEFERLDAVQLVKHAFGLRTQAQERSKSGVLVYLYAEPPSWPDGRMISDVMREQHRIEMAIFEQIAAGAEVRITSCTYKDLLAAFLAAPDPNLVAHAMRVRDKFAPY